jgi:uncharacterized protein YbcV (DUF1398 family)
MKLKRGERAMNSKEIHEVMTETQAGRLKFSEVVGRLLAAGVESYFVDFATGKETVYGVNGEAQVADMTLAIGPVAESFSAEGILGAIRGAQADTVRYPEFVKLSTQAGVIGYWAFLTGSKVVYFGRKGQSHTEMFPGATA